MPNTNTLFQVEDLNVEIPLAQGIVYPVKNVSFSIKKGEVLGIVGESGCGKSMTALGIMNLLPKNAIRAVREMSLLNENLLSLPSSILSKKILGNRIGMIFQDPMSSLNPVYQIGRQLTETMQLHSNVSKKIALEKAIFLLEKVGIPDAKNRLQQYPHQLSGGQRQRVMIAIALMNDPDLIIADEPTTALDVTIQAQILRLLVELQKEIGMSMVLITHDLGIIAKTAHEVAVMYAGEIVEQGKTSQVFNSPQHPYTFGLLKSIPELATENFKKRLGTIPGMVPSLLGKIHGCSFENRCLIATEECKKKVPVQENPDMQSYKCVHANSQEILDMKIKRPLGTQYVTKPEGLTEDILKTQNAKCVFQLRKNVFSKKQDLTAVDEVTLELKRGEVLALVGESGCGKTTLAKILLGLQEVNSGKVTLGNKEINEISPKERARKIQPVFQDPYSSLNPRKTIGQIIQRPLDVHGIGTLDEKNKKVEQIMELVGLQRRLIYSYPSQISGGQRQRVAIARAIIIKPDILICDEPTSALDVSVQSQILNLLLDLQEELELTYLLITHDLSVVQYMATRIAVMYLGQIVETGNKDRIFSEPKHPYTKALLKSVLSLETKLEIPDNTLGHDFPNPLNMPKGCRFHPRCKESVKNCSLEVPTLKLFGDESVRCSLV